MSVAMVYGHGVVTRHSRRCKNPRERGCPCQPGYQAWVFDRARHKKRRKTFRSEGDARAWRLAQLRLIYGDGPAKPGRTDVAYGLLRRAMQELDGAQTDLPPRARAYVRDALTAMYQAEDALLSASNENISMIG